MFEIIIIILQLTILFAVIFSYMQTHTVTSEIRAEVKSLIRHNSANKSDHIFETAKSKSNKELQDIPPEIMAPSILRPPRPTGGFGSKAGEK